MRYRGIVAIALMLTLSLTLVGRVTAHGRLVSSNPKDGSQLDRPPDSITLVFNESLDGEQSSFSIRDDQGHMHGLGQIDLNDLDRRTISGPLGYQAEAGIYTITWSIITPHNNAQTDGTVQFRVGRAQEQQARTTQLSATPVDQTNAPIRRHDPEPLPVEMQRPVAVGLLITFIVVIAVIMINRVRHPRR